MNEISLGSPLQRIVVVGTTGSGKTTALYTALNRVNSEDRNIVTIEVSLAPEDKGRLIGKQGRVANALRLLLDRACYGDPGEIMRGLRHSLEAIVDPDWPALADVCLEAARSPRPGTRLWAIDQLAILDDARARPVFEDAVAHAPEEIRERAQMGLDRLDRSA